MLKLQELTGFFFTIVDPNAPSAEYPAFKCVTHYRTQYLQPLVSAGADLNAPKGILETAVQCHNLEALNWLLDSGKVSPNDKAPKTGCTPLTTAIRENRPDLVVRSASPHLCLIANENLSLTFQNKLNRSSFCPEERTPTSGARTGRCAWQ